MGIYCCDSVCVTALLLNIVRCNNWVWKRIIERKKYKIILYHLCVVT